MPNYDYKCEGCGHRCEIFQKISDAPLKECPSCHQQTLQRGPGGGIGLSFKGSGFYINDYASPQNQPSNAPEKGSGCCPCGKNPGSCSSSKD